MPVVASVIAPPAATVTAISRAPRIEIRNGIYHVVARGNERKAIYRKRVDREHFLEILALTAERYRWRVLAYCLMSNHYRLLVETPNANLARGMRQVNGVYAQAFNRRHGRDGHLFQGRYQAILVQADRHLLSAVRYILRNPLRAGMCERVEEPYHRPPPHPEPRGGGRAPFRGRLTRRFRRRSPLRPVEHGRPEAACTTSDDLTDLTPCCS